MFTLDQIKAAHSKVKTGADFPAYVQELITLGVRKYDFHVNDGHTSYEGKDGFHIESPARYPEKNIAETSDTESFTRLLKAHQQGQSDFPTMCQQSADTGVEKWTVDMNEMTCTYYDKMGNKMLVEEIPTPV
jgi:uncharacterized protein YbcV (DUF1398 family)